ncbi:MAG: hypothetical protein MI975_00755 [Cytophagales bacterium]|nr:hypothetical protein [Cytophagales bacterium]
MALDNTWERNQFGEGMITFVMNWFALTETLLKNGNQAYTISKLCSETLDPSGTTFCEQLNLSENGSQCVNPYFLTGYSSFILVPIHLMLQSHDGIIQLFPAMPEMWSDALFYDLPAEGGLRVSAELKDGSILWVKITKDDKVIYMEERKGFVSNKYKLVNGSIISI